MSGWWAARLGPVAPRPLPLLSQVFRELDKEEKRERNHARHAALPAWPLSGSAPGRASCVTAG